MAIEILIYETERQIYEIKFKIDRIMYENIVKSKLEQLRDLSCNSIQIQFNRFNHGLGSF